MKGAVTWDDMRAELPQDVRDRLNGKQARRHIGEAITDMGSAELVLKSADGEEIHVAIAPDTPAKAG